MEKEGRSAKNENEFVSAVDRFKGTSTSFFWFNDEEYCIAKEPSTLTAGASVVEVGLVTTVYGEEVAPWESDFVRLGTASFESRVQLA
jgi:hypothetical protein